MKEFLARKAKKKKKNPMLPLVVTRKIDDILLFVLFVCLF